MKSALCIALLLLPCVAIADEPPASDDSKAAIARGGEELLAAFDRGDVATLQQILPECFTMVTRSGLADRVGTLALAAKEPDSGTLSFREHTVAVNGNLAQMSGILRTTDGSSIRDESFELLYAKSGDSWKPLALRVEAERPAGDASTQVRVGTYDSRAVALAWFHSGAGEKGLDQVKRDYDQAKKRGDRKRMQSIEQYMNGRQQLMHLLVFGSLSNTEPLAGLQPAVDAIAAKHGVAAIVSKWSIPFKAPGTVYVDLTGELVNLFNPNKQVQGWIKDMDKQSPVASEKLLGDID